MLDTSHSIQCKHKLIDKRQSNLSYSMSSEKAPENGKRETPSISRNIPVHLSNLSAESFPTRLSTRQRKPSEHIARKCCACLASPFSKSDQRRPHRSPGDANKAAATETSLLPCKDDSETRRRRTGLAELLSLSRQKASVNVQRGACRNKSETSEKASARIFQRKLKVAEAETSRTTLIKKQPAVPPNGTRANTASPQQVRRTRVQPEDINAHKIPTAKSVSPAQVGLSKQPSKKTMSSPTTSKLKNPPVTKNIRGKEPEGQQSSQGQKASNCQSKLSKDTDSDCDSDSSSSGSDWSSETSDMEHHITWDVAGFDHRTGWTCNFCEEDLAVASWGEDEHDREFFKLPVVSILSCGHNFHSYCLDTAGLTADDGEPTCVLCESATS